MIGVINTAALTYVFEEGRYSKYGIPYEYL